MKKFILILLPVLFLLSCKKDHATKTTGNTVPVNPVTPPTTTLTFSGYTWSIKNSGTTTAGPGPNNWAAANAFVDSNGYLHLKLTKSGGKWYCAEVTSTQSFGYGTYQWNVEGRIDTLDKNVVLGLFNYSGDDGYDEMDIECSKFGSATGNNMNFTVYPAQTSTSGAYWHVTDNTTLTGGDYTTQRFKRNSDASVYFEELAGFQTGDDNLLTSATCSNPPNSISAIAMPIHMNLWLFKGAVPTNNAQVEIIIHSFTFTAL